MREFNGERPTYAKIYDVILQEVSSNRWEEGTCIWPESEICQRFSVSRITAIRALNELAKEGVIRRERGVGSILLHKGRNRLTSEAIHIVAPTTSHFFSPLGLHLFEHLRRKGMLVSCYAEELFTTKETWSRFLTFGEGTLVLEGNSLSQDIFGCLEKDHAHFRSVIQVLTGNRPTIYPCRKIEFDETEGGRIQARYAIRHGAARIVVYSYPDFAKGQRMVGIREECAASGVTLIVRNESHTILSDEEVLAQTRSVVETAGPGGAILCDSDHQASFLQRAIRERGWIVGRDLLVIGFYDTPWAKTLGLASVTISAVAIAAALDRLLSNPQLGDQVVIPELVEHDIVDMSAPMACASVHNE